MYFGWELEEGDVQLIDPLDEGQKGNVDEWARLHGIEVA